MLYPVEPVGVATVSYTHLAQTALVCLKLLADPEKQLASIEYWIMGSLNGISLYSIGGNIALCLICLVGMFLLYRQILLLSLDDQEGRLDVYKRQLSTGQPTCTRNDQQRSQVSDKHCKDML